MRSRVIELPLRKFSSGISSLYALRTQYLVILLCGLFSLTFCSTQFAVTVNQQTVYDPRIPAGSVTVADANLQGCINLALSQQDISNATELTVISCPGSGVESLEGISQLTELRFIDLADNLIIDLKPLSGLERLSGFSIPNNRVRDISPLFAMQSLSAVILTGNSEIPCGQLNLLEATLGNNLTRSEQCQN